jgi:TRIAD3 protein (E3 ubiquitin-protein ligase RNF216)
MKKYDELQYEAVVEGFKDTSKCTKCDFIAFAEETISTFHCPRCNFKSCRECGEEAHPGIRCDEVETKNETSGRNKVEEAMTNAVVRKCPRPMCRKPFMKTGEFSILNGNPLPFCVLNLRSLIRWLQQNNL